MDDNVKTFECNDDDFSVESEDEEEVVKIAKMHQKEKHGMDMSDDDIKSYVRTE